MRYYPMIVTALFAMAVLSIYFDAFASKQEDVEKKIASIRQAYSAQDFAKAYQLSEATLNLAGVSSDQRSLLYYIMGSSKRFMREYSTAFSYYDKAINATKDPDQQGKILLNMGALMAILGQHQEAIRIYTRSAQLSAIWSHVALYNRALSQKASGDLPGAIIDLKASLKVCEEKDYKRSAPKVFNQLGLIEMGTGRITEARDYFFMAINADVDTVYSGVAWHNIALTELQHGDTTQAILSFEQAIPMHFTNDQLFLTYYDLCELYINMGIHSKATHYYHLADSLYRHSTVNDQSLKLFFRGMDLGLASHHDFEVEFNKYSAERDKTIETYQAYAGALLLEQMATQQYLKRERQIKYFALALLLVLAAGGWWFWNRKRMTIQKRIQSINKQYQV